MTQTRKRRAFFSAFRKDPKPGETFLGVTAFARALLDIPGESWELEASTGTFKHLKGLGLPVVDLADRVGEPMFDHRVVTLSRQYHGGLLMADTPEDWAELARINATLATDEQISMIDLVYCDPYPFLEVLNDPNSTPAQIRAAIDIGGSAMIRAAAKMGKPVICRKDTQPQRVIEWLRAGRPNEEAFRNQLCWEAFAWSAEYDLAIAKWLSKGKVSGFIGTKVADCKYGENAPQQAALYKMDDVDPLAVHQLHIQGQPPSYVGITDYDSCLNGLVYGAAGFESNFGEVPDMCLWVKHGTFGGAVFGSNPHELIRRVIECDRNAITGGVLMTTFAIDEVMAEDLRTYLYERVPGAPERVMDGLVAPAMTDAARARLERKEVGKWRTVTNPALADLSSKSLDRSTRFRKVRGGFLEQTPPLFIFNFSHPKLQISGEMTDQQKRDLVFAVGLSGGVRSNTEILVLNGQLLGIGCNQTMRDRAMRVAVMVAKENGFNTKGAVLAGDSFPFGPEGLVVIIKEEGVVVEYHTNRPEPPPEDEASWARKTRVDTAIRTACVEAGAIHVEIPDNIGRNFSGH